MVTQAQIMKLIQQAEEGPLLDYKEDLSLQTDGDKAEFVKDVVALANSGEKAHMIVGVKDGGRLVGSRTTRTAEQMNQILKDRCDPSISVEYVERNILGHRIGVIEIKGENAPYIVSVPDRFGGPKSANPKKLSYIQRGTVFVRNYNINEGARRADLDGIYNRIKYVPLEADVQLTHEMTSKASGDSTEASIKFFLLNQGGLLATDIYLWMQFENVKEIAKCTGSWLNISDINNDVPTLQLSYAMPVIRKVRMHCPEVVVKVDSGVNEIKAYVRIGATNMRTKEGSYVIPLKKALKKKG